MHDVTRRPQEPRPCLHTQRRPMSYLTEWTLGSLSG